MDNFEDIKQLWAEEKALNLPSVEEMQTFVSTAQKQTRGKILLSIFGIVVCLILLILVAAFSKAEIVTTLIGETLMFSAIAVLLTSRINSLRRNRQIEKLSNREFVAKLKSDITRLANDWNGVQKIAFLLTGGGYSLFLYESVRGNQTAIFIGYGLIAVVMFAVWFFVRRYANGRKLEKKRRLLEKIENLEREIKE